MDADAQLMLAFQQGDRKAFETLFRRHARAMVNFAYRFVENQAAAEELAQDIFCKVFESAHSYTPAAKFTTWLYRVATNHCLNEVRRGRYHVREISVDQPLTSSAGEMTQWEVTDDTSLPDERAAHNEFQRDFQACLLQLPENQRAALTLLVEGGLSYEEIAATLRTSVSAVKALLVRARSTLKDKLRHHLEGMPCT